MSHEYRGTVLVEVSSGVVHVRSSPGIRVVVVDYDAELTDSKRTVFDMIQERLVHVNDALQRILDDYMELDR